MATVRDVKKVRTNLQLAMEYSAEYLQKSPEHAALGAQAQMMSARLLGMNPQGKEADPANPGDVSLIAEAAAIGGQILDMTDAGRKLPRVSGYIKDAQALK